MIERTWEILFIVMQNLKSPSLTDTLSSSHCDHVEISNHSITVLSVSDWLNHYLSPETCPPGVVMFSCCMCAYRRASWFMIRRKQFRQSIRFWGLMRNKKAGSQSHASAVAESSLLGQDFFYWHHIWLLDCRENIDCIEQSINSKLQCCINETILHVFLPFIFILFLWSASYPFSSIQPARRGWIQLIRPFSGCGGKKPPLHFVPKLPLIQRPAIGQNTAILHRPPQSNIHYCVIMTQSPYYAFSLTVTFIKSFLTRRRVRQTE